MGDRVLDWLRGRTTHELAALKEQAGEAMFDAIRQVEQERTAGTAQEELEPARPSDGVWPEIHLPMAPPKNKLRRPAHIKTKKGKKAVRLVWTSAARKYLKAGAEKAALQWPLPPLAVPVERTMHVYVRPGSQRDHLNVIEIVDDSLEGVVYTNDRLIHAAHEYRVEAKPEKIVVKVVPL